MADEKDQREYSTGELTVFWDPKKCIHAGECVRGLPEVFDKSRRPWINIRGASSEEIKKVIDRCPTGALSYKNAEGTPAGELQARIRVIKDGPLTVQGGLELIGEDGALLARTGPFALCRCGRSKNKPYCDGSHRNPISD